jgi:hypothetical protein
MRSFTRYYLTPRAGGKLHGTVDDFHRGPLPSTDGPLPGDNRWARVT